MNHWWVLENTGWQKAGMGIIALVSKLRMPITGSPILGRLADSPRHPASGYGYTVRHSSSGGGSTDHWLLLAAFCCCHCRLLSASAY